MWSDLFPNILQPIPNTCVITYVFGIGIWGKIGSLIPLLILLRKRVFDRNTFPWTTFLPPESNMYNGARNSIDKLNTSSYLQEKPNGEIPLLTQKCPLMLKMESNHSGTLFWHFYCVLSVRLGRRVESHSTVDAWWWSMKAILEIIMHFDECKFWWM